MARSGIIQSNIAQSSTTQSGIVQSSIVISVDDDGDRVDPNLYQQCETKIVELEYLVNHLKEELSNKNLRHVKNVVNNIKQAFTIINDIKSSQRNSKHKNTW
ncbi:29184_t:CDS:1, partial [Gigaspora margarita]